VALLFQTGPAATLDVRTDTARQLEWLQREDPHYLLTHASNLGALAEQSLRRGIRLPRLRQARTFSEALRPALRDTVRAAWGVETADTYSCEEAGYIALQCPRHEHYHVQAENLVVEVLDPEGRPCAPGETGEVVLTTLHNFALPLIRYRLGDYAEVGAPCDCGRGLPVLRRIHGRQRNMLRTPDGRELWPSLPSSLWLDVVPLEQFQVIQKSIGQLEINYVMARDLTPDEQSRLATALTARLGYPFDFDWQRRERLERTAGGKFEDFISLVPAR
jgi:phenylacetate-CoA ligase